MIAKRLAELERRMPVPPPPAPVIDWGPVFARMTPAEVDQYDRLVGRYADVPLLPNGQRNLGVVSDDDLDLLIRFQKRFEAIKRELSAEGRR